MNNERRKITGSKRPLYIWNESENEYNGRLKTVEPVRVETRRNEPPRWIQTGVGCLLIVALIIYGILLLNVQIVEKQIDEMNAKNESVLDTIEAYETAISDARSREMIAELAKGLNMVDGNELSSYTVYVPNRGGNTLTASAGGNK